MTDTEETDVDQQQAEPDPMIPVQLRTYGLSGEPLRMAPYHWQVVVAATRAANVGDLAVSAVQPLLDTTFPDAGYLATDICLAHPPVGDFTATVTGMSVRVDLAGDVDLLLPDENVEWNFGDGEVVRDAGGWDHEYVQPGTYTVQLVVLVAGRIYASSQDVEVSGEAPPVLPEGEEFDPADHTVDEVLAYIDEHPDELDDVLAAEEDGKNRVTLVDKLTTLAG